MTGATRLSICLVGALCLALLSPSVVYAQAGGYSIKNESHIVKTRFGRIYVEVARPMDGDRPVVGPAIFTYSPYSVLGRNGDQDRWVPKGYVRVWADVVGTGNSGGCYDYGGRAEKRTGHALVEWIARQPWSTGKVAMIGGSYNGTTAIATAVTAPPHLTTIVPEAAISRWYEYAYSGGIRYTWTNEGAGNQGPGSAADEGLDTPLAFDFGLAIPPPLDATDPTWAERVESTVAPCEEIEHTEHGYDLTPDYDRFWLERDYIKDAEDIQIPVLVAHNWGDWNVKQEEAFNLYRALDNARSRKLFIGTRWEGHGTPGGDYDRTVTRWFDHYLMGEANGITRSPRVHSEMSNYDGATSWYEGNIPSTERLVLHAQHRGTAAEDDYEWRLLTRMPRGEGGPAARFVSTGTVTETAVNAAPRSNAGWMYFESPRLARDLRIFGSPRVKIWSRVERSWITYTPTLVDIDPAARVGVAGQQVTSDGKGVVSVTRGWLDSRYRNGLDRQQNVAPGKPFGMTVVQKPQDYTFKKGHSIGLSIQTEIAEWATPKPYAGCASVACNTVTLDWRSGRTKLVLPVVGGARPFS